MIFPQNLLSCLKNLFFSGSSAAAFPTTMTTPSTQRQGGAPRRKLKTTALESDNEETLRRVRFDNITVNQPLTDGVIVTAFASSNLLITVDGCALQSPGSASCFRPMSSR